MGRRKKDSVTRCFNIQSNIYCLLEHLTENGFLTLTQAVEKSIKGRFISEFGEEEFFKIMGIEKNNKNKKIINKPIKEEPIIDEAIELERMKAERRARKAGVSNG